jgi:hypothetical protein
MTASRPALSLKRKEVKLWVKDNNEELIFLAFEKINKAI